MSEFTTPAYYKDGIPYNYLGEVIITIPAPPPPTNNGGGGGSTTPGIYGGATSQSGHSLAKWSTENLKKSKAAQEKRVSEFNQLVKKSTNIVNTLFTKLKTATDKAVAAAQSGPSATDLAHQTNKDREAEALRASLWRKQKEIEEEKRRADEELKEAKKKYEEEKKKLEEEEKRLKEAEEEEKRIAGLSPEEQKVIYAERDVEKSKDNVSEKTKTVNALNQKRNKNITSINTLSGSLKTANDEVTKLKEEKVTADERVKRLVGFANDDVRKHMFIQAGAYLQKVIKDLDEKQTEVNNFKNQIDKLNKENNKLKTDIADAKNNESHAKYEHNQNIIKLESAREQLANASLKAVMDKAISFSENMSKYLSQKLSALSNELAKLTNSKKIKGIDDAVAKHEKFKNSLNKKFSVKDRQAITNALKSVEYAEWSKQFDVYAKGFKFTGTLSTTFDITKDFIYGIDSGNWKPFFLSAEKLLAGKYITGVLGGVLTALIISALPVLASAAYIIILELMIIAILDAIIAPAIDAVADLLVDAVSQLPSN